MYELLTGSGIRSANNHSKDRTIQEDGFIMGPQFNARKHHCQINPAINNPILKRLLVINGRTKVVPKIQLLQGDHAGKGPNAEVSEDDGQKIDLRPQDIN
jgi:hypothetical protein